MCQGYRMSGVHLCHTLKLYELLRHGNNLKIFSNDHQRQVENTKSMLQWSQVVNILSYIQFNRNYFSKYEKNKFAFALDCRFKF